MLLSIAPLIAPPPPVSSIGGMGSMRHVYEAESQALAALYKARCPQGMSQAEFGERFGLGTQGMVSQYMTGKSPLNVPAAVAFARGLGVTIRDFSPRLADQIQEAYPHANPPDFAPSSQDGREVMRIYDAMPEAERRRIAALIKLMVGSSASDETVEEKMSITKPATAGGAKRRKKP